MQSNSFLKHLEVCKFVVRGIKVTSKTLSVLAIKIFQTPPPLRSGDIRFLSSCVAIANLLCEIFPPLIEDIS